MTSAISSPDVWPEERLRARLQESSHSLLLSVGDLAADFGVRRLTSDALRKIESALGEQQVLLSPRPFAPTPGRP
jgi:hypothetical protein